MELQSVSMPGYRINEYRLVVPLPEALQEKINSIRQSLHQQYQIPFPFQLKPGLTILRCHAFEKTEAKLIEHLQRMAMSTHPFKVELEDYAAYPSHTIYIHVPTKRPFNELCKELKKAKRLLQIPKHEPHFINEPHLILAQRLKPKEFVALWSECEHRQFSGRFIADPLLLLKRTEINKSNQVVSRLEFMSLPMPVKQGELFS